MARRAVVALALLCAVALSVVASNAATAPLEVAPLGAYDATHPCGGQASATAPAATATTVQVALPSQDCTGMTVQVTVLSSDGTVVAQGAGSASGGTASVPVSPAYTATAALSVQATVGGWSLPVTWAYAADGPVSPGNASTVVSDVEWTLVTNNPVQVCFTANVSTASATSVPWRVTLDLAQAPFNGADPSGFSLQGSDGWRYQWFTNTPSEGYLQLGGTQAGGRTGVVAGQTYAIQVCNWRLPAGVQTPSAYSVSSVPTTWTATKACLATTVTANGSSRFYFGWTALLDMTPSLDRLAQGGRTFSAWTYSANEWQVTRTPATDVGPDTFRVVSNSPASLVDTRTFTFETCANSYR